MGQNPNPCSFNAALTARQTEPIPSIIWTLLTLCLHGVCGKSVCFQSSAQTCGETGMKSQGREERSQVSMHEGVCAFSNLTGDVYTCLCCGHSAVSPWSPAGMSPFLCPSYLSCCLPPGFPFVLLLNLFAPNKGHTNKTAPFGYPPTSHFSFTLYPLPYHFTPAFHLILCLNKTFL